jgi:hypothetical protein
MTSSRATPPLHPPDGPPRVYPAVDPTTRPLPGRQTGPADHQPALRTCVLSAAACAVSRRRESTPSLLFADLPQFVRPAPRRADWCRRQRQASACRVFFRPCRPAGGPGSAGAFPSPSLPRMLEHRGVAARSSPSGTGANVLPDQNGLTRARPVGPDATGSRDLTDHYCSGLSSQVRRWQGGAWPPPGRHPSST